jgi:hypothetical protein
MTKTDALPDRRSGALDTILTLRLNIAAFGEQDALGWWDSYALGDVGEYALGRLFPRTAHWAALELGCEAARRRQQHLLEGIPGALHLFDLGSQAESLLHTRILSYKAGELTGKLPMAVHTRPHSADGLDAALRRLVGDDAVAHARSQTPPSATVLHLSPLTGSDAVSLALRRARALAAAYAHSDHSRLVVPYMLPGPQAASR